MVASDVDSKLLVRSPNHDRHNSLGGLAIAWIEHFCVHGPGDVQGNAIVLDDEFAGFIYDAYALSAEGRRLYRTAFLSRSKGRAKSELAGFLVLYEAFGPARFAGYATGGETFRIGSFSYTYSAGEPMGRTVTYPFIRCLATEETQAGNTYDNVYYNLGGYGEGSHRLIETYGVNKNNVGLTKIQLSDGGEIVPSTASSSAKDGGKESFAVFDETHLYVLPELQRMWRTVNRNLQKRKDADPWGLETSTMYAPGEESIAEQSHKTAQDILAGKLKMDNLLFDHRQASMGTQLGDIDSLRAGLIEAYGPAAEWMDLDGMIQNIYDPRNPVSDSRRYFLNQPTAASDSWLTYPEWEGCRDDELVLYPGEAITLGFDGSQKRARGKADATALIACRLSDGALFPIQIWEQPDGPIGEDWRVSVGDVEDVVASTFDTYKVMGFYADPAKWESSIAKWEREYGQKMKVKSSPKNPIEWWMTAGRSILVSRALERFENAVHDHELLHNGNQHLTQHALNAKKVPTPQGFRIQKEHPQSSRKIDAVVAAVLAFECRADAVAQGVKNRRSGGRIISV
jgi:hypothetical protein